MFVCVCDPKWKLKRFVKMDIKGRRKIQMKKKIGKSSKMKNSSFFFFFSLFTFCQKFVFFNDVKRKSGGRLGDRAVF